MSVKQGFLALLSERPMGGYQLRQEFEARTGGTWPLNIGQAYTTLQRLARDGLVEPVGATDDDDDTPGDQTGGRSSASDGERYRLTEKGRAEATAWWLRPVERGAPARDELAIKLALAVTVKADGRPVDVAGVIQRQRVETMRALRDYTRLKHDAGSDDPATLAWSLVLDSLIFAAEAEARWLDHVEASVARAALRSGTTTAATAAPPAGPPAPTAARRPSPTTETTKEGAR